MGSKEVFEKKLKLRVLEAKRNILVDFGGFKKKQPSSTSSPIEGGVKP